MKKVVNNIKKGKMNMELDKNIVWNINGRQVNIANENAVINAVQNNGGYVNELDDIIKGIKDNIAGLRQEDADQITDAVEMAKEELTKPEPRDSRLKSCLSLLTQMLTIANGIPKLAANLQKLQEFIMLHI
ncbi:MAG: hypothetical protein HDR18_07085 [Lachnospiraceae bacterium]|nr:hypothetical protein [Lachnospiraceae bacterium]